MGFESLSNDIFLKKHEWVSTLKKKNFKKKIEMNVCPLCQPLVNVFSFLPSPSPCFYSSSKVDRVIKFEYVKS